MPLRADIVRKKLLQIDQATARLRSWLPVSLETLQTDLRLQWAIERGLFLLSCSIAHALEELSALGHRDFVLADRLARTCGT